MAGYHSALGEPEQKTICWRRLIPALNMLICFTPLINWSVSSTATLSIRERLSALRFHLSVVLPGSMPKQYSTSIAKHCPQTLGYSSTYSNTVCAYALPRDLISLSFFYSLHLNLFFHCFLFSILFLHLYLFYIFLPQYLLIYLIF